MNDAWFTGPLVANSAATLPRGHVLAEPYLYDATTQGSFSSTGARQSAPHANSYGSLTYLIYGLSNRVGVGLIPTFTYNQVSQAPSSAGVQPGDLTAQAQVRLTNFRPCSAVPTVSVAVQQTFPTGRYDQLGDRLSDGVGAGAYTTNFAVYTQEYFWLPNHRIVRTRFNASEAISSHATVLDASVYGTSYGFRGTAHPGAAFFFDAAQEYSLTRRWVFSNDLLFRHNANTSLAGTYAPGTGGFPAGGAVATNSGPSDAFGFAPAVEYSWRSYIGVIFGVRTFAVGRNTSETITPAIAINYVH